MVLRALSNANAIALQIGQGLAGVDYSAGPPRDISDWHPSEGALKI